MAMITEVDWFILCVSLLGCPAGVGASASAGLGTTATRAAHVRETQGTEPGRPDEIWSGQTEDGTGNTGKIWDSSQHVFFIMILMK